MATQMRPIERLVGSLRLAARVLLFLSPLALVQCSDGKPEPAQVVELTTSDGANFFLFYPYFRFCFLEFPRPNVFRQSCSSNGGLVLSDNAGWIPWEKISRVTFLELTSDGESVNAEISWSDGRRTEEIVKNPARRRLEVEFDHIGVLGRL